jgi:hypothetical protein
MIIGTGRNVKKPTRLVETMNTLMPATRSIENNYYEALRNLATAF